MIQRGTTNSWKARKKIAEDGLEDEEEEELEEEDLEEDSLKYARGLGKNAAAMTQRAMTAHSIQRTNATSILIAIILVPVLTVRVARCIAVKSVITRTSAMRNQGVRITNYLSPVKIFPAIKSKRNLFARQA
jgi:hypothetical protein